MMIPSNYTIRLIDIKDDDLIQNVLNNYEIYDNNYRNTLNNKIINHFMYQEIGFETPKLFAHYLKCRLDEIMPKYNKLYNSQLLNLDPLRSFSLTETMEKETEGEAQSLSSSSGNTATSNQTNQQEKHIFQNTPQGNLSQENINNYSYATTNNMDGTNETNSGTKLTETEMEDSTNTSTTENYVKSLVGNKDVSTTKLFKEFVENFESVDKLIINELQDLFMGIY